MPNWGLTDEQREMRPWGIDPQWLAPGKTLTDPVHGDIYLNRLEVAIVDSPPMQRLRRVRQLGTTHLSYDGATHSRLSHALGTLRAAQDLLDAAWNSRSNPQARDFPKSLLDEWEDSKTSTHHWGRATVLARLGALLHDLCHVPIGHTVEDDLGIFPQHDGNTPRFELLWSQMKEEVLTTISPELLTQLKPLILSKDSSGQAIKGPSDYPFVGDIVGNTICADLIDYLQRDHLFTGLPLALGKRFMDSFFIVNSKHPLYASHMVIGIERDGRVRSDIVTELLKLLRYRYELTERVLTHHAKLAADAMWSKILDLVRDDMMDRASKRNPRSSEESQRDAVALRLERLFLRSSDDSLLERFAKEPKWGGSGRRVAAQLAADLQNRRLYKSVGLANGDVNRAIASKVYETFGSDPRERRRLEREAAAFAGVSEHQVVIWLPEPKMRLKVAEVLVYRDRSIAPLSRVEPASEEIAEQHQRLWGVNVFAAPELRADRRTTDSILAYLGEEMGLSFHRRDGTSVPGKLDLAVETVIESTHASADLRDQLSDLARKLKIGQASVGLAASVMDGEVGQRRSSETQSFQVIVEGIRDAGIARGLLPET